jgi:hypothetical protein
MSRVRVRGGEVRSYILDNVEKSGADITKQAAERFSISRQAVNKHMRRLVAERCLTETGKTRSRIYKLASLSETSELYLRTNGLSEDLAWSHDVKGGLGSLPDNVMSLWQYGFTEMFNNAIDHSSSTNISVRLRRTATTAEMLIFDNGIGIFKKIQQQLGLLDERHARLELSKGKLTTDPTRHSGEGIFFTSRMFDSFNILSGGLYFTHTHGDPEDWILENQDSPGTAVFMRLHNHTSRTIKKVFDQYSSGDDYGFNKTVVPVKLAQYGNDKLISRSQAKRLLARVDLFQTVLFDFEGVPTIGQAFADEIFRVFALEHPNMVLHATNANSEVKRMIARAKGGLASNDVKS